MTATLEKNLRTTQDAMAKAAERAGRHPEEVTLLAVTKSVNAELAHGLAQLGQTDLGENRLPSLLAKREYFQSEGTTVTWHYIGHIQRNKARRVIQNSDVLHSVDSLQLIATLERIAGEENRQVPIYLEVKLSADPLKHGFMISELQAAIVQVGAASHLSLLGLMTMASRPGASRPGASPAAGLTEDASSSATAIPAEFAHLRSLAKEFGENPQTASCFQGGQVQLSMGMSGDFPGAIAAGSHVVRIGSALFQDLNEESSDSNKRTGEVR